MIVVKEFGPKGFPSRVNRLFGHRTGEIDSYRCWVTELNAGYAVCSVMRAWSDWLVLLSVGHLERYAI